MTFYKDLKSMISETLYTTRMYIKSSNAFMFICFFFLNNTILLLLFIMINTVTSEKS